jgi:hypothetical protein
MCLKDFLAIRLSVSSLAVQHSSAFLRQRLASSRTRSSRMAPHFPGRERVICLEADWALALGRQEMIRRPPLANRFGIYLPRLV